MKIGTAVKTHLKIYILLMASFSFAVFADPLHNLKNVGQGKMSWLFMDIYHAALFTADGSYQARQYPQALTLRYQRNISKNALLKATKQQWQNLSIAQERYQDWLPQLEALWPEIKNGDRLIFVVAKNGLGDFYHNDNWLGGIDSPDFSDAFLSIWLSANSSEPGLRRKLIGESK